VDWREFIASLVDSLAWPAAAVALVALLRSQIAQWTASGPLRRLKLGPAGAELEWEQAVVEVAASSVRALPTREGLDDELSNLERMAERTPDAAIQQTFALVERELARLVDERRLELPIPNDRRPQSLIRAAYHGKVITKETGEALRGLLTLRDLAAHTPHGESPDRAIDYVVLARGVLYALSRPPS
jgi:hypothetical protein